MTEAEYLTEHGPKLLRELLKHRDKLVASSLTLKLSATSKNVPPIALCPGLLQFRAAL